MEPDAHETLELMTRRMPLRTIRALFGVVALGLAVSACGGSATDSLASSATIIAVPSDAGDSPDQTAPSAETAAETAAEDSDAPDIDSGTTDYAALTSEGVMTAAVLIVSEGDLEGAIASGLVTEPEAEAALQAIADGTLDEWAD
ncbi:MAG: hypothetical protein ACI8Y4_000945 [Candidatus Poriferisodalaceae bacterium]|jgi:hypothetical protein